MPRVKTFLYAVRMLIPGMEPQPIKIGFSSRPDRRKAAYNSGPFPCEWLGIWPGTIEHEQALHRRYAHLAVGLCGEWFLPDEELTTFVSTKIAVYQKRLDHYARFAIQRAEREAELQRDDKDLRMRAAQILEDRENLN